jgi:hypothetical protein
MNKVVLTFDFDFDFDLICKSDEKILQIHYLIIKGMFRFKKKKKKKKENSPVFL